MRTKNRRVDWIRLLVWSTLALILVVGWFWFQRARRDVMERAYPWLKTQREREKQNEKYNSTPKTFMLPAPTNSQPHLITRTSALPDEKKADIAKLFYEKFRPALERWGAAYSNRIPFALSDVTMDKFHSTLGSHMFTFMIGDTTLTFMLDKNGEAKVGYLMVRQAALDMNRLPSNGFVPDLNVPVTATQIISMIRADTGVAFKPNEVIIRPTGKASALNGGAFVDILPTGADPNNFMNYKLSMTFDSSGKLVNYERDPSL